MLNSIEKIDEILRGVAKRVGSIKPNRPVYLVEYDMLKEAYNRLLEAFSSDKVYLSTIAAVDRPEGNSIEVNYFVNIIGQGVVVLRYITERTNPRVPSLIDYVGLHSGELETFDMFGVVFEGNPYLRRGSFVPSELAERGVYPLRKK